MRGARYSGLLAITTLIFSGVSGTLAADYARPTMLVEPATLLAEDASSETIILDARSLEKYEAGHVPSARWVNHSEWAKTFGEGSDTQAWSKRIGQLGIQADSTVVVYDDNFAKDAARIWWILKYWGVEDVRLLNGGWVSWTGQRLPVSKSAAEFEPAKFQATPASKRLSTMKDLLGSLKNQSLQIVDARTEGEHCGTDALKNKRAGAIPGAKHLEWIDLIDDKTHKLKPANELQKIFEQSGIDLDRPTATHCQSGGRAAVMAFGLELMGAKDVSNYYRSWSEWGNDDTAPIETPKPKK